MHCIDKYSEQYSIIWPVWPNIWVFVYELSGSGFECSCSHLNFRLQEFLDIQAIRECGFTLKGIRDMTRTYSQMHRADKYSEQWTIFWFLVRVQFNSLKLQISCLLQARSSLTLRQLQSVDSLWNAYVTWQEHTAKCIVQISTQNNAELFGQFGQPNGIKVRVFFGKKHWKKNTCAIMIRTIVTFGNQIFL